MWNYWLWFFFRLFSLPWFVGKHVFDRRCSWTLLQWWNFMEISLPWCLKGGHRCANLIMTHPDTNRPFTVRARGFQAELSSKVQLLCCISLEVTHVMRWGHIKSTSVAEQESFSFVEHLGNRWWYNSRVGSLMIGDGHEWCNCLANYTIFFQIGVEAPSLLSSSNALWPITCRKLAAQAFLG